MKKRFISAFLIFSITCTIFAGCGKDVEKKQSSKSESQEVTTLNFLTFRGDDKKVYDEIIHDFEKENPNIKVNVEYTPGGQDHYQLIKTRALSDELDIYCNDWGAVHKEMVDAGYALDLTDESFTNNYEKQALEAGTVNGKVYGIAQAESTMAVYFNKEIFEKYNLETPQNWADLMNVCEKLKKEGIPPIVLGLSAPWLAPNAYYQIMASRFPELTADAFSKLENGEISLYDEPFKTVSGIAKELVEKGYIMEGSAATDPNVAASLLMEGKAAMAIEGTWRIGTLMENENFDFGMFLINAEEGESTYVVWPNQLHVINPKSPKVEEAKIFFEYLSRPEVAEKYSNGTKQIPVVKGVVCDNEKIKEVRELMNQAKPVFNPVMNNSNNEVTTLCWDYMTRVFLDEDLEDITNDVQSRIDALIE